MNFKQALFEHELAKVSGLVQTVCTMALNLDEDEAEALEMVKNTLNGCLAELESFMSKNVGEIAFEEETHGN